MKVEIEQGVHLGINHQDHAAAATTVPAVGTTERLELLPVHRGTTVAAIARTGVDDDAVNEPGHGQCPFIRRV